MALSNQHQVLVSGSIKPLDDVTFEAVGAYYWFDDQPDTRFYGIANKEEGEIGGEINLTTTYDYTEDVTFSLFTGWFFPGEHYEGQEGQPGSVESGTDVNPQVATEIIGTMKVSF